MASPGNSNQAGGPFDRTQFFNLPFPNPILQNPSNGNLTSSPFPPPSSYPLPPSTSYPPLTRPYSYTPPPTQFHHRQYPHPVTNLHHQRSSVSYPTPPLQPPLQNYNAGAKLMAILGAQQPAFEISHPPAVPPIQPFSYGYSEFSVPPNIHQLPSMPNLNSTMIAHPDPMRMPSSKLPTGRHLIGDHVVYDIDSGLEGEAHPQLEVTPITKYGSDPGLVLGRRIAVNKTYICYGLKMGAVRVLNMNSALRSLLKGLTQRVTDMAFFAEDVHLLASASVDGRVYVWKITEGPDEEDTPQITGKIVIAIQIVEGEPVHPRVCWHCHKQGILVVGIGKRVLRIDTAKVVNGETGLAEVPIVCDIDNLIDGVQHVGKHEGEVTDLSMCHWMTTRVVSASTDGTIKIWDDRRQQPLAVLRPHDGQPVNFVTFLSAHHRPEHIVLITGGPMNREVKIWTLAGEEDWLLPSDGEAWHCTQTLVLKSSAESRVEESFFNQVVALSQPGLLLLANAKKNAIYAVHFQYGPNPAATQMDYISEFTVAMPILSFTGALDLLPHGEHIVQVYCVQTQAIQKYGLDLSQCLPPPLENTVLDKSDSIVLHEATTTEGFPTLEPSGSKSTEISLASSAPKLSLHGSGSENAHIMRHIASSGSMEATTSMDFVTSSLECRPIALPTVTSNIDISCVASAPLPLCPRLSKTLSALRSPTTGFEPRPVVDDHGGDQYIMEYFVDRQMDTVVSNLSSIPSLDDDTKIDKNKVVRDDISAQPISFKHPTHLVTPSEILMANSSSEIDYVTVHKSEGEENIQDVAGNSDISSSDEHNVEVDVKVVGETGFSHNPIGSQGASPNPFRGNKERVFYSPASDLGIEMAKEDCALSFHTSNVEEFRQLDGSNVYEALDQASNAEEEVLDSAKDISGKNVASAARAAALQQVTPITKWKKQKGKNAQGSGPSSQSPSAFNSADSSSGPVSSSMPSAEAIFTQVVKMQEMLSQLTTMQKEMQKQMTMTASDPVSREGRRLETSLGRNTEKAVKANCDALWTHFQEENTKQEKSARERTQEITGLVTNCINKDLPALVEKTLKKELCGVGPNVARTITPVIEKATSVAIAEAFQRGVGDKAVYQLEKSVGSKLEVAVARQIQAQFQTSGKQALQESLKTSLEFSVIPALEMSCKAMFDQVDASFHKGMVEHTTAAQQQFDSTHSPLTLALRDAITSVSSMTQTLSLELADGQRKLLGFASNSKLVNPFVSQWSNGVLCDKIDEPWDPAKELSRLVSERKYEQAFNVALQRSDVSIVSWLCSQVDLQSTLLMIPLPLSQGVLLSLLQQLACDVSNDTSRKLAWMTDVAVAINPADPMIAMHVRLIFEQVYQIINNHHNIPTTSNADLTSIRLVMHVINSMLMACK